MNIEEHLLHLAQKIKKARIASEMTQKELAGKADIPLSTYRRFEQKGEGSVKDLVKVMIALGRIGDLDTLLSTMPYSPIAEYERGEKRERKRVRHALKS